MTPLQTLYLGLASAMGLGVSYGVLDSGLMDTVEKARETTQSIDTMNRKGIIEAASIRFQLEHGRTATVEELVEMDYLKKDILEK